MKSARDELSDDLARVASGDVEAFVRVYKVSSRKLFGVVLRILGRSDIADEVLQEVYVRVWSRAADFRPELASPITWLVAIARNRALDEKRRRQPGSLEDVPGYLDWPSDQDISAEVLHDEELRRLQECLERLPPDRRMLVELVYLGAMTRDGAAAQLHQSPASIRNALRASLAQIKRCLENE